MHIYTQLQVLRIHIHRSRDCGYTYIMHACSYVDTCAKVYSMIGGSRSLVSFHMCIRVISTYNIIIYSFNSPCKRERRPEIASSTPPPAIVPR